MALKVEALTSPYPGPTTFEDGNNIPEIFLFVESLPPYLSVDLFKPFKYTPVDKMRALEFVIAASVDVRSDSIVVKGVNYKGTASLPPLYIYQNNFAKEGLRAVLFHEAKEYLCRLYPQESTLSSGS